MKQFDNVDFCDALKRIVDTYGQDIYLERERLISILKDFLPKETNKIKLLENALTTRSVDLLFSPNADNSAIEKSIVYVQNNCFVERTWAEQVVNWIAFSISLTHDKHSITYVQQNLTIVTTNENNADCDESRVLILDGESIDQFTVPPQKRDIIEAIYIKFGVKYIKKCAFKGMKKLRYIYISESVDSIAKNACSECPELLYVEFEHSPALSRKILSFEKSNADITLPEGIFSNSPKVHLVTESNDIINYAIANALPHIKLLMRGVSYHDDKAAEQWEEEKQKHMRIIKDMLSATRNNGVFKPEDVRNVSIDMNGNARIPAGFTRIDVSLLTLDKELSQKMRTLTLPMGLVFLKGSFRNFSLKTVYLPPTMEEIEGNPFSGCDQLSIRCVEGSIIRSIVKKLGRNTKTIPIEHFN